MRYVKEKQFALLQADDPAPVEWVNRDSNASVLFLCEHAGNAIPQSLNQLGLTTAQLDTHVGLDVGAATVARELAALLQVPLILQRYSRLVIDCNRPFYCMKMVSIHGRAFWLQRLSQLWNKPDDAYT